MRCLTLEKSSKAVFPINRNTAIHMRYTQSPSVEGFTATSWRSAASNVSVRRIAHFLRLQDAMLIEMALPSYIHAGRFSCEHEIYPQECTSEQ